MIARSQRCNIEASDVLRAENDAGRRERDADEIDDALNNDNEGSRNQSCSNNNNNNNNNIKSSKRTSLYNQVSVSSRVRRNVALL